MMKYLRSVAFYNHMVCLFILLAVMVLMLATQAALAEEAYTSAEAFVTSLNVDGGLTIPPYVGTDSVVRIPPQISGVPVTAIGSVDGGETWQLNPYVFANDVDGANVVSVIIPEGVITIGTSAFANCPNLQQVDIPYTVATIEANAFQNSPQVIIHTISGTYAEHWAQTYQVPVVTPNSASAMTDTEPVEPFVEPSVEQSEEPPMNPPSPPAQAFSRPLGTPTAV